MLLLLTACGGREAAGPVADHVLYQDAFLPGETGKWLLEGDEAGQTAVVDGKLVISVQQPNTMQYTSLQEPLFDDFSLEVEAQQVAGSPESSYGVLVRMRGVGQFYRFEITSSGLYMAERHNGDGSWDQYLDDWAESEAINQGLNASNRLKIVADGPSLQFYVNDTLLHEVMDNGVGADTAIGLDAGAFGASGLQVAFDNLVIQELPAGAE